MIDWTDYGIWQDGQMPNDWTPVLSIDSSGGYEWTTLHAFYSPTERLYYWASGSGCSCNSWGYDLHTAGDFESGNKAALRRSIRAFAYDYSYAIGSGAAIDAVDKLARFKEPKL